MLIQDAGRKEHPIIYDHNHDRCRRHRTQRNFMSLFSSPHFSSLRRRTWMEALPTPFFATRPTRTTMIGIMPRPFLVEEESRRVFSSSVQTMNEQWKKMMDVGGRGSGTRRMAAATNNNTNSNSTNIRGTTKKSTKSITNAATAATTSTATTTTTSGTTVKARSSSAAAFMSLHRDVLYVDTSQNDNESDDEDYSDNVEIIDDDFSNIIINGGLSSQSSTSTSTMSSSASSSSSSLLESDVETLTKAYLSQLMPPTTTTTTTTTNHNDDRSRSRRSINGRTNPFSLVDEMNIDSTNNSNKYDLTSLDHELGMGSIWDNVDEPDDDDEEEGFPEEEYTNNSNTEGMLDDTRINSELHNQHTQQHRPFPFKTPMEMLRSFDSENPPTTDDPLELQLWMECWSQREAVLKHQQLVDKARDRKAFDAMSLMQRHVIKWFEDLRQAIDARQKEYLSRTDKRRAHKRYGPFLCSLHPEKMAVIASQEAIVQSLSHSGKSGLDGVPLVKIASAIGSAVEMEVVSQRRMKERFHKSIISLSSSSSSTSTGEDSEDNIDTLDSTDDDDRSLSDVSSADMKVDLLDKWKFSASHLKLFMDDLERTGMGRNRRGVQYAMRKAKQAMNSGEAWTQDDIVHVGAALLSILVDHTKVRENGKDEPAFRVEKKWLPGNKSKSQSFIIMHDRLRKAFLEDEYLSWAANTTRHTPMIVPPTDWSGPNEGGYKWLITDLMRTHGSSVQKEALQHSDLSLVCDGLNILGKTAWTINKKILEVGEYCWNNNIPIGDIPSRTDFDVPPEPERPSYIDPEVFANRESPEAKAGIQAFQAYNENVYRRKRILQKNMDLNSLRCSATLKLDQANRFKDFERIYFPYNLDFRGRACKF